MKRTTMTDLEEKIIKKGYGKNATPILHKDTTVEALISANCRPRERVSWIGSAYRMFRHI